MLKRILLLLTIVATGGGIICSVFYGVWTTATYLGNIDRSVQELTKTGENRDKAVQGVQNTLVTHWQAIQTSNSTIERVENIVVKLQGQISDFQQEVTGSPSVPRGHDGRH